MRSPVERGFAALPALLGQRSEQRSRESPTQPRAGRVLGRVPVTASWRPFPAVNATNCLNPINYARKDVK